jgi:L-threonylcarbamoyladenylate synthase
METRVLKLDAEGLSYAKELILSGDIVAFPTETVYGLGANVFDLWGVEKIFTAKGRPFDNPLIVHISDKEMVNQLAEEVSGDAKKVIDAFMPGPLTIVLKKRAEIHDRVTGGLKTVAIRMPSSKEAQAFLKYVNVPVAAPSANTSTRPSPTCYEHVLEDLDGKIPLVLKGKSCDVGIESTVVDFSGETPMVLRPGIVTPSQISKVTGKKVETVQTFDKEMNSPGMRYKHYAPNSDTWLNTDGDVEKILEKYDKLSSDGKKAAIFAQNRYFDEFYDKNFFDLGFDEEDGARNIFAFLREGEKQFDALIVVWDNKTEVGLSVLNRLLKSCGGQVF